MSVPVVCISEEPAQLAPNHGAGWPQFGSQQVHHSSIHNEQPEFTLESLAAELTWLSSSPTATGGITGDFYSIVKKYESCVHTEKTVRRAKTVRFADTQGLPLEEVVHPLTSADPSYTDNEIVPYSDEDFFGTVLTLTGSQTENRKGSSAPVIMMENCKRITTPKLPRPSSHRHTFKFSQPGNDPRFLERLAKENVVLEHIRAEPRSVHGIIRVSNISYHKEVTVRWTHDNWKSFFDTPAVFCATDGETDRFTFDLPVPINGDNLQFAIRYRVDGNEFWDNNRGQNYNIIVSLPEVGPGHSSTIEKPDTTYTTAKPECAKSTPAEPMPVKLAPVELAKTNKEGNSSSHQTPPIPTTYYSHSLPVIQNYSSRSEFAPPVPFVDPVEVLACSSSGGEFTNKAHDVTIRIPEGTIPEGLTLAIEVGVTLHGPFSFPTNLRPISPILWLCPQQDIPLQKPVEVILPHFLNVSSEQDHEQFGLCFLKADHNDCDTGKYNFLQLPQQSAAFYQGEVASYGHLYTRHFCFLCIAAKKNREVALNAGYCLSRISPTPWPTTSLPFFINFIVTYFLKTCLRTLDQQFPSGFEITQTPFDFENRADGSQPRLVISLERPEGWLMTQQSMKSQITAADVDCWTIHDQKLKLMEERKIYPPRFEIRIHGSREGGVQSPFGKVTFSGATDELYAEIPAPLPESSQRSSSAETSNGKFCSLWQRQNYHFNEDEYVGLHYPPSEQELMEKVAANIPAKWRDIGIQLGLASADLDRIEAERKGALRCFETVFYEWKRGKAHSTYKWPTLLKALKSPPVKEFRLADTLVQELQMQA